MPLHILDTPRLRLRTLDPGDATFYLALVSAPSFLEHIGDKGIRDEAGARAAIQQGPMAMQRSHGYSFYLVERRTDGVPLGICGLVQRDSLPAPDIGYALLVEHWGQGYGLEAASAVLAHARHTLGLPVLLGITSPGNHASIALLHKIGLRLLEQRPLPPHQRPTNIYRIDLATPAA